MSRLRRDPPVAQTGIPLVRDGTKNVPLPYKHLVINIIEIYTSRDPVHRPVPANVPSRLSYKQALKVMGKNNFSYCYYKMAYCAYSCAYSRLLVKYLLARSRNLL
jgi:hypothetical protein